MVLMRETRSPRPGFPGADREARLGHPVSDDADRAPESEASTSEVVAVPAEPPAGGTALLLWRLGGLVLTVRPHQWVKNVFVLAPMIFARELFVLDMLVRAVGAFGVFCLLAGAVSAGTSYRAWARAAASSGPRWGDIRAAG
jgi:hypothetical protein